MGRCQHAIGGIAIAALSLGGCRDAETPTGPTARSSYAPLEVRCLADATLTHDPCVEEGL